MVADSVFPCASVRPELFSLNITQDLRNACNHTHFYVVDLIHYPRKGKIEYIVVNNVSQQYVQYGALWNTGEATYSWDPPSLSHQSPLFGK